MYVFTFKSVLSISYLVHLKCKSAASRHIPFISIVPSMVRVSFLLMHCSSSFTRRQRRRRRRRPSLRNQIDKVRVAVRSVRYTHALTCTGMSQRVPACPDLFLYYPDSLFDSLVFAFAISLCQAPEKLQIRQHLIFIYLSSIPPYPFPLPLYTPLSDGYAHVCAMQPGCKRTRLANLQSF